MESGNQSLSPPMVYQLITDHLGNPTVFKHMIDQWPSLSWNIDDWGERLKNKKIRFRLGEINEKIIDPVWEGECAYIESTIEDFGNWLQKWPNCPPESAFKELNPKKTWCYADYKYMAELFQDDSDTLETIDWSIFGFNGRNGKESTLWIGSTGAHTPCHYDTYGFNLVAQLYGEKRWILFPPNQSDCLQPTRIPYEESSVFSKINICNPQLTTYPEFRNATPYVVRLKPGDVLFVPRHWWHYVETLEPSVSINTWLETEDDDNSRLQEAISRLIITSLAPSIQLNIDWLNPTEEITSIDENLLFVQNSLKRLLLKQNKIDNKSKAGCHSPQASCEPNVDHSPRPKLARLIDVTEMVAKYNPQDLIERYKDCIVPVEPVLFDRYISLMNIKINTDNLSNCKYEIEKSNFPELLLNCIANPQVISVIGNLLKKNFAIETDDRNK